MCQLYAMNSQRPVPVAAALQAFMARGGRTGDHVDGWGVVFHRGASSRRWVEPQRACDSARAAELCRRPIRATTVLAHVRKATHGVVAPLNCHPFQRDWRGRRWSFCHNGKLLDYAPVLSGLYRPQGQTDSELALCWLLEQLEQRLPAGLAPDWPHVAPLLAELATRIGQHGEFNFTLTDGRALYALGATRLAWLAQRQPERRLVQIATEPLGPDETWQRFAPGELKVWVAGEERWSERLMLPWPAALTGRNDSPALAA